MLGQPRIAALATILGLVILLIPRVAETALEEAKAGGVDPKEQESCG